MRKNRTIRMSKETSQMMKEQLEAFKEKFGREAGPDDPVFFNPDCERPYAADCGGCGPHDGGGTGEVRN